MRESRIENALTRGVLAAGGGVRKFVTPGRRHAADRLVIIPHPEGKRGMARIVFVELKAPGKKPRGGQKREHKRLVALGCTVYVIDTLEGVQRFLQENC